MVIAQVKSSQGQGGLILAQVQRDTRPLETAVDTVLELARLSPRDVPADGDTFMT